MIQRGTDMKRITIMGLCLVAMFATSAVVTASASAALPEFTGYCKVVKKVIKCGLFPIPFTSSEKTTTFETADESVTGKVVCKAAKDKGQITGPKTDTEEMTFTGCKLGKLTCTQKGIASIKTVPLESEIGYINSAAKEVGDDLKPAGGGTILVEFECGETKIWVEGSIIGRITPINVAPQKLFHVTFTSVGASPGHQNPSSFEGGPNDTPFCSFSNLKTTYFCAFGSEDEITTKYATELKA